jgi:ferredoxin
LETDINEFRLLNDYEFIFLFINQLKNNEIMAITKVWIEDGCTGCGLSEAICPEVFKMDGEAIGN